MWQVKQHMHMHSCSSPDQKTLVEATAPASTGFILLSSEEQKRGALYCIALCVRY